MLARNLLVFRVEKSIVGRDGFAVVEAEERGEGVAVERKPTLRNLHAHMSVLSLVRSRLRFCFMSKHCTVQVSLVV